MKHTKIILLGLITPFIIGGAITINHFTNELTPIEATQELFTLTLDSTNPVVGGYKDPNGQVITKVITEQTDKLKNEIQINAYNATSKGNHFAQLKGGSGEIYNVTPLNYIQSIEVHFTTSDKEIHSIFIGTSSNASKITMSEYVADNGVVKANFSNLNSYFKIAATGRAAYIEKVIISYFCTKENANVPPDSGAVEDLTGIARITYDANNDFVIPTSYTNTGFPFKVKDINIFANYITENYSGGGNSKNDIYLKEKGYGTLMNTNPITGLQYLSFIDATNVSGLDVYASNTFNKNWEKITFVDEKKILFDKSYSYFMIKTNGDNPVSFDTLDIKYDSAAKENNEIYKRKTVDPLKTEEEAQSLIQVSSTPLINEQRWIDKGYAKNEEEAIANTANKLQSGYNGYADYHIDFNKDVIYDNNLKAYRVCDMIYGPNKTSFQINMLDGSKGPVIYKEGIYTFVEDIAAYMTAFGDAPKNMRYLSNEAEMAVTDWGINGRVNYTAYSNDNDGNKFKFETENSTHRYYFAPQINQNNYWYNYYESDYGADVGNSEPYQINSKYYTGKYNNGQAISKRGSLRFVWTKSYTDLEHNSFVTEEILNPYDRNVFFTSNHYNDFQQYLNYYGGWSLRFGNTTLGNGWGTYNKSNHLDASPEVTLVALSNLTK